MKPKRIGLFGGTFNPIHLGHITMAKAARNHLRLNSVHFIPNATSAQTKTNIAPSTDRIAMIELALDGLDWAVVDLCEIARGGVSYTIDTVQGFRAAHLGDDIFLLVGFDAYLAMANWHRGDELLRDYTIAVMPRRTSAPKPAMCAPDNVYFLPLEPMHISSSEIHKHPRDKLNAFLPPKVLKYINQNQLYL